MLTDSVKPINGLLPCTLEMLLDVLKVFKVQIDVQQMRKDLFNNPTQSIQWTHSNGQVLTVWLIDSDHEIYAAGIQPQEAEGLLSSRISRTIAQGLIGLPQLYRHFELPLVMRKVEDHYAIDMSVVLEVLPEGQATNPEAVFANLVQKKTALIADWEKTLRILIAPPKPTVKNCSVSEIGTQGNLLTVKLADHSAIRIAPLPSPVLPVIISSPGDTPIIKGTSIANELELFAKELKRRFEGRS